MSTLSVAELALVQAFRDIVPYWRLRGIDARCYRRLDDREVGWAGLRLLRDGSLYDFTQNRHGKRIREFGIEMLVVAELRGIDGQYMWGAWATVVQHIEAAAESVVYLHAPNLSKAVAHAPHKLSGSVTLSAAGFDFLRRVAHTFQVS